MQVIMTEEHTRDEILVKARQGDRAALDELVAALQDRVRAFIRTRIQPELQGRLDIEDVLHDTIVRAYKSISGFRGDDREAFVRWILGVARIAVIKAVNSSLGRPEFEITRDAFLDPGEQIARELLLDTIAGVYHQPRIHVTPVSFGVGIHAGKGALHDVSVRTVAGAISTAPLGVNRSAEPVIEPERSARTPH